MSPTARTLDLLRREGYLPAVVERWLPGANVRKDLWGFGDVLAVHPGDPGGFDRLGDRRPEPAKTCLLQPGTRAFLIVQATTLPNIASRLNKARALPALATWLQAGGAFEVHGWVKRNGRWAVKRVAVRAVDLATVAIELPPRRRRKPRHEPADLFAGLPE